MKLAIACTAVCLVLSASAAPVPQLAGEGAACNSVLSDTDNGVGHGVENAEENTAATISSSPARRQLAGEGAACDSVLTQTDNGVGHGVENAEDNTAATISSSKPARRQLDKIANGAGAIGNSVGAGATTGPFVGQADTIDGQSTDDAATVGSQAGGDEDAALENAGKDVP